MRTPQNFHEGKIGALTISNRGKMGSLGRNPTQIKMKFSISANHGFPLIHQGLANRWWHPDYPHYNTCPPVPYLYNENLSAKLTVKRNWIPNQKFFEVRGTALLNAEQALIQCLTLRQGFRGTIGIVAALYALIMSQYRVCHYVYPDQRIHRVGITTGERR